VRVGRISNRCLRAVLVVGHVEVAGQGEVELRPGQRRRRGMRGGVGVAAQVVVVVRHRLGVPCGSVLGLGGGAGGRW
jgi:hypothetical protein